MFYDRKIKYFDYFEDGERVRGGGFVKLEAREGRLRVEASVSGLHATDSFSRDVLICGKGRDAVLGKIVIAGGRGQYRQLCHNLRDIGGTGIGYGELQGLRIPLGTGRELSCRWTEQKMEDTGGARNAHESEMSAAERAEGDTTGELSGKPTERAEGDTTGEPSGKPEERAAEERTAENAAGEAAKNTAGNEGGGTARSTEKGTSGNVAGNAEEETAGKADGGGAGGMSGNTDGGMSGNTKRGMTRNTNGGLAGNIAERTAGKADGMTSGNAAVGMAGSMPRNAPKNMPDNKSENKPEKEKKSPAGQQTARQQAALQPVKLLEDKWQQLCAIYPHVTPFRDKREYLSIGPADFVIFPSASYKLVNNSFLLHGYYNYRHLILARMEKKGETCYYVGVPGSYFEKEKQVAVMFGFESFECAEEPAQTGDFGYYMMRTEL